MNILFVNWRDMRNPLYGGAELHITKIAEHLALKNTVYFLTSSYKGCRDESVKNVNYIHIGGEFTFNFFVYFNLKRLSEELKIDLIIEDINKVPFYSPLFVKIPVLVMIPHIFGTSIFKQAIIPFALYVYLSEKPIRHVYRDSYFEVISDSTRDDLVRRGIDNSRIIVSECGVDYTDFPETKKSKEPLLVYVGRLKKYKSVQHIIEAMPLILKNHPDAKLKIVGTGDYRKNLEELVLKMNLSDKVEFTGYLDEKRKFELLKEAWVSLYPSFIEGWGIVNIEANALGTPVLSADVPGLRDSVKDGYSGLLYRYGDTEDLSTKLDLIIKDKSRYDKFSVDAKEWSKNFTWEKTVQETETFINKFLTGRSENG